MNSCLLQDSPITARYARFGPYHIDQQRRQVFLDSAPLRLPGKVYQVLIVLLQKHGQVVTREELRHALWPDGTHVNYQTNTNTAINKLRRALSESANKVSYIETIPRSGYRFVGTVEFSEIPFPTMGPENSPAPGTSNSGLHHDAAKSGRSRSYKLPTKIAVALILVGMLLGATAATYWMTHFA